MEKNKAKRPAWYQAPEKTEPESEVGGAAVDGTPEFCLAGINEWEYSQAEEMLRDPTIWIADSGATVHMTAHKDGMQALQEATDRKAITMGNGNSEQAAMIGTLKGTICDKSGAELNAATMSEVMYLKN